MRNSANKGRNEKLKQEKKEIIILHGQLQSRSPLLSRMVNSTSETFLEMKPQIFRLMNKKLTIKRASKITRVQFKTRMVYVKNFI